MSENVNVIVDPWNYEVTRVYQDVISEADPAEGMQRQEAYNVAIERLLYMVEVGEIQIDMASAIRHQLEQVDRQQGKRADSVIKKLVTGQDAFDQEDDPFLRTVVTLGSGKRKAWRDVTSADLVDMDYERFKNVQTQMAAYSKWKENLHTLYDATSRYGTIGRAVDAGALGMSADVA